MLLDNIGREKRLGMFYIFLKCKIMRVMPGTLYLVYMSIFWVSCDLLDFPVSFPALICIFTVTVQYWINFQ